MNEGEFLEAISEAQYPINCATCDYNLTGLGEAGRCPECGLEFVRQDRLHEIYSQIFSEIDPGLDPAYDISHVNPDTFPVDCAVCGNRLQGAEAAGVCPRCGTAFERRLRLWQTHGPEAFVRYDDVAPLPPRSTFPFAIIDIFGVLAALALFGGVALFLVARDDLDNWHLSVGLVVTGFAVTIALMCLRDRLNKWRDRGESDDH